MVDIKFHSADKMKTAGWQGKKKGRNIKKTKQKTENNLDFKAGFHFNSLVHLLYKLLFIVTGWSFCACHSFSFIAPHRREWHREKKTHTNIVSPIFFRLCRLKRKKNSGLGHRNSHPMNTQQRLGWFITLSWTIRLVSSSFHWN